MNSYSTLKPATAEVVVSRSRFISFLYPIDGEDDAKQKLTALRKKYYDATHICYAYIADEPGNVSKSADDGEPSSTAGAPIMTAISGYRKVLLAVVRYFGGTKLGVGGLIKAYTDAANAAIACSSAVVQTESNIYGLQLGYNEYEMCKKLFATCKILKLEYGDKIQCELAAKADCELIYELQELFGKPPKTQLLQKSVYINYGE